MRLAILMFLLPLASNAANIFLTRQNHVAIRTVIDDSSIASAQKKLAKLVFSRGSASYPLYVVLDSPGGSIDSGNRFIEYAKTIPNLHTVTLGAASMASAIVEALPGRRYILETGYLMFHRARGGVQGQFEDGELESRLEFAKKKVRQMEKNNAKRLKLTLEEYKKKVVNEYWINGFEAVEKNAADEVVSLSCSKELIEQIESEQVNTPFGSFKVERSSCPLVTE